MGREQPRTTCTVWVRNLIMAGIDKDRIVILWHSYLAQTTFLRCPCTMPRLLRNSSFLQCYSCANVSMLYAHKVLKIQNTRKVVITVRLTFLTQSIGMKPNFQALLWVEFSGFVNGELWIRLVDLMIRRNCYDLIYFSLSANLIQFFIVYDRRSTNHSPA